MAQQMNALFDEARRRELRDAIRKGEALFAGRDETEPLFPGRGKHVRQNLFEITITTVEDPSRINVGYRMYTPNDYLLLAISYGDLKAVELALEHGAGVNHKVVFLPVGPHTSEARPTRYNDPDVQTPLQYAEKLGMADIAEFLKQRGATE